VDDPQPFKVALAIGVGLIFPTALYHRLRAHDRSDRLDRRQEGVWILLTLRPIGFVFIVSMILYMVNPARLEWSTVPLPLWLRWAGVPVMALAEAMLIWTLRNLGKNLTDTVVTRRHHTLVTTGPYKWVRHPFYITVGLLMLGVSLLTASWFLFVVGSLVLALLAIRTRVEEANLEARFGNDYRAYAGQTGRFFPRLR
jgi:protein-S-isoprenylcysteine O-methyltransferase Ste14